MNFTNEWILGSSYVNNEFAPQIETQKSEYGIMGSIHKDEMAPQASNQTYEIFYWVF